MPTTASRCRDRQNEIAFVSRKPLRGNGAYLVRLLERGSILQPKCYGLVENVCRLTTIANAAVQCVCKVRKDAVHVARAEVRPAQCIEDDAGNGPVWVAVVGLAAAAARPRCPGDARRGAREGVEQRALPTSLEVDLPGPSSALVGHKARRWRKWY